MKAARWVIREAAGKTPELSLNYGMFLQNVIDFLIISFSIFMVIRFFNQFRKKEVEEPSDEEEPTKEEELLTEIRDILKTKAEDQ